MDKQALLSELHLRSLQLVQQSPTSARKTQPLSQRAPNSTRTLMKLYLTRQILEECIQSLDIFRELLDDPVQRRKLVRDINKNLQLKLYDEGAIVYARGEVAESLYMVIKGHVSLCMPGEGHQEQQIDVFGEGVSFGEAEFVHGRKRSLVARAKSGDTVVGVIEAAAFEEIIELYRQRVYLKKLDMFGKCPLLQQLQPYQLEFIANNAKPAFFPIGKEITKQKESANVVFLISEGSVQLRSSNPPQQIQQNCKYRINSKCKLQDALKDKIKIKNLVVGVLQQGQFLGDCELALGVPYIFTAIAKSQKVRAYACDERIILSQMTPQMFTVAARHYKHKQKYREDKPQTYQLAKSQLQRRLQREQPSELSPKHQKIKRIIASRYVQPVPSIFGHLSPKQIEHMVDRKKELAHSYSSNNSHCLPTLNIILPQKKLVADQHAYSPLLRREREQQRERRHTEVVQPPSPQHYKYETALNNELRRSETRPPLVFMRPFVKKVLSLHERLSKELIAARKGVPRQGNYSVIQMRKVGQTAMQMKQKS